MNYLSLIFILLLLGACGTSDSTLRNQGKSDAYLQGFHDGRHSGMQEEGNHYEYFIKDEVRFDSDPDYQSGWLAGEAEGKTLQDRAVSAGRAAAGAYSASEISKEVRKSTDIDKAARDTVKGVDTTGMDSLTK